MDRRQFLLSGAVFALPVPPHDAIGFTILRNGGKIGEHHLRFESAGDTLTVTANAALRVTLADIPLYRYTYQSVERWRGGVFQGLDSKVNDNGNALTVHAEKVANGYEVEGVNHDVPAKTTPRYQTPPDTMPLTYWNAALFDGTVLNPQTAHSYRLKKTPAGWNQVPTTEGGTILAQRFEVTGKVTLSVWYDQNNNWASVEFHKDGDITYQKIMT